MGCNAQGKAGSFPDANGEEGSRPGKLMSAEDYGVTNSLYEGAEKPRLARKTAEMYGRHADAAHI